MELKLVDDGHGPGDITKSDLINLKNGSVEWKSWADGVHYDKPWCFYAQHTKA